MVTLTQTIPALPARNVAAAVDHYRDRFGFAVLHHDGGFAVLGRDEAVLHLWEASDESWQERGVGDPDARRIVFAIPNGLLDPHGKRGE